MGVSSLSQQTIWRQITWQTVATTASSTAITTKFGTETHAIRLVSNTPCYYLVGDGVQTAASTTSSYLPGHWVEYVKVTPGQQLAVLEAATAGLDTAAVGTLWVTELTA